MEKINLTKIGDLKNLIIDRIDLIDMEHFDWANLGL